MKRAGLLVMLALLLQVQGTAANAAVVLPPGSIAVPSSGTFLYLHSLGDFVGDGREILLVPASGQTLGGAVRLDRSNAFVYSATENWSVNLSAPQGQALAVGSYVGAERFQSLSTPGLDVYGNGRGCSQTFGSFDVNELAFSSLGEITVFDATFEQHCETPDMAPLYGRVRIESPAPAPGSTLPPGSMTVPASGTFLYLIRTNTISGTYEQLYTPADSTFDPRLGADVFVGYVTRTDNSHFWTVSLAAPLGVTLSVGEYRDALRTIVRNAVNPGMDVYGDGQGCNEVHGSFTVEELSRAANGELRLFQATFHFYCDNTVYQRHGRIRVETQLPPVPPPVLGVSVKGDGMVNIKTGAATIGGTVSCDRAVALTVSGAVTQTTNKTNESVAFSSVVYCTAPSSAWSIYVYGGVLRPGDAMVSVTASWCEDLCVSSSTTRSVQLNSGKG